MGKLYQELDATLQSFIAAQHLFFVATAPNSATAHLNLSPKGLDGFRVLGPNRVAYLDYNGSGVETIAHLRENGRIVFMFCAFQGSPKILRLYGRGRAIGPHEPEFLQLLPHFAPQLAVRSIILADLDRISDACGYGVPHFDYRGERDHAHKWAQHQGDDGIRRYQADRNAESIDGLPGLEWLDLDGSENG